MLRLLLAATVVGVLLAAVLVLYAVAHLNNIDVQDEP
jgi:hypothetical protein